MTWCQVSEDHCWIALGPGREDAIEVTTDTAAKRGLAPSAEAWAGWLYNGGHAVLCSPQVCQLQFSLSKFSVVLSVVTWSDAYYDTAHLNVTLLPDSLCMLIDICDGFAMMLADGSDSTGGLSQPCHCCPAEHWH